MAVIRSLLSRLPEGVTEHQGSQAGLVAGFGVLLVLLLATAWVSATQMAENQRRSQAVLDQHVTKLELITRMRHEARERTIALQKLTLLDDPFEQDEVYLAFNRYGASFAEARQAYLALGLSPDEELVLAQQGELTRENVPIQREVADLVLAGERSAGHALLIDRAIPLQDQVFEQLDILYHMQRSAAEAAATAQAEAYFTARSLIWTIAAGMIVLGLIVAVFAVSRTRRYQVALSEAKEQATVTLSSIADAVLSTDALGRIEYLNPRAEHLFGRSLETLRGKPLAPLLDLRRDSGEMDIEQLFDTTMRQGESFHSARDLTLHVDADTYYAVELTAAPLRDGEGHIVGSVLVLRDVTELRQLDNELSYQATHDALTGLLNRHEFERRVRYVLESARVDQSEHAICYLDLDMFKTVNDTCGHVAGDELLRQLATLMQRHTRKTDALSRLGGDEFGLLLQSCSLEKARSLAETLVDEIARYRFHWENHVFHVGASVGVAPLRTDSGNLATVIQSADFACYSAKEQGRNRVCVAESETGDVGRRRGEARWVRRISDALEQDGLRLFYQPIRSIARPTDAVDRHIELLVRLQDASGEIVAPASFLPAAERYHLMPAIDRWVVTEAARLLGDLGGRHGRCEWRVNINLSGQTLSDQRFLDFVLEQIELYRVPTECLCFEITETCAIANISGAMRFMNTLKGVGCSFALDDFGSGLSSFAYLKNIPVEFLKIDGAFVRDAVQDPTHRAMVASIAQVARVMGIRTIAEFVENEQTLLLLRELGVDAAQGYYFARPQPLTPAMFGLDAEPGVEGVGQS